MFLAFTSNDISQSKENKGDFISKSSLVKLFRKEKSMRKHHLTDKLLLACV